MVDGVGTDFVDADTAAGRDAQPIQEHRRENDVEILGEILCHRRRKYRRVKEGSISMAWTGRPVKKQGAGSFNSVLTNLDQAMRSPGSWTGECGETEWRARSLSRQCRSARMLAEPYVGETMGGTVVGRREKSSSEPGRGFFRSTSVWSFNSESRKRAGEDNVRDATGSERVNQNGKNGPHTPGIS